MLDIMSGVLPAALGAAEVAVVVAAEVPDAVVKITGDWSVLGVLGAVLGAGIIVFGAALGISRLGCSATEAIARQPEAGQRIFTSMLLAAAFIEGGMLLALIVCIYAIYQLTG